MAFRNVISTLMPNGEEIMGPTVMLWHYPNNDMMNGSLLTVESNHFCVLKSRGRDPERLRDRAVSGRDAAKVLFRLASAGVLRRASPWQYEALYINRAKLVVKT